MKKCGDDSSSMSSDYDLLIRKSEQFNTFNHSLSNYDDPGIIGNTIQEIKEIDQQRNNNQKYFSPFEYQFSLLGLNGRDQFRNRKE